jgi:hypothetical protein
MIGSCNGESKVLQVDRPELSLCREVEGVLCERHVLKSKRKFPGYSPGRRPGAIRSRCFASVGRNAEERVRATRCGGVAGGLPNDWTRLSRDHT